MIYKSIIAALALGLAWTPCAAGAKGLDGLVAVPLSSIRDCQITPLGAAALSINPTQWKHAESENFVYHYFQSFIATPVSVEAEFYYRVTAGEFDRDTTQWQTKCHIYIFEQPEDWAAFQKKGALDPWSGGVHSGGDLFVVRDPRYKYKDSTLAHEIAHLVLHRFFGPGIPLWLNEGFAEYAAAKGHAAFYRARGFNAKPRSRPVPPQLFIPLAEMIAQHGYPADEAAVVVFYIQSEKLVRFLAGVNADGFRQFLEAMARGNRFETALHTAYGTRFTTSAVLETEFRAYASKDFGR